MTIRYSKKLSQLLVLSLGLCVAATALGRDDDSSSSDEKASSRRKSSDFEDDKPTKRTSTDAEDGEWREKSPSDDSDADASSKKAKKGKQKAKAETAEADSSGMPMSIAALGSFGPSSENTRGGVGLRAGVHLDGTLPFYFGGIATYFFGLKQVEAEQLGSPGSSTKRNFMYAGAEAGVDLSVIQDVTIRPYLGLGVGRAYEETCGSTTGCKGKSDYPLTITPSVLGLYNLGSGFFVGADVRFLIAAGASPVSGPILSATLGFKF